MAGYGYTSRDHTTYNGTEPHTDRWSKQGYVGDGYSDHVNQPVPVNAAGAKHPLNSYTPNPHMESYVAKTETIVEARVHIPMVTEYRYSSPTKVESPKEYGFPNNKWGGRPLSSVNDRPQKVEEFITEIQNEASRPTRTGPLGTTYWRKMHNSTGPSVSEYGFGNKEWNKPSGNSIRNDKFNGHHYQRRDDTAMEPAAMITTGGWTRPNHAAWAAPPNHELTKPTNDIGAAVEFLKEAAKPSYGTGFLKEAAEPSYGTGALPQPRFSVSVPKRDTYPETIDSRDAMRRYGNFNPSTRPFTTGETYRPSIDSREAMKKYNGTTE